MSFKLGRLVVLLLLGLLATAAQAQSIREQRVHFAPGQHGTTLSGRIRGYQIVDYLLGANAGQRMVIDFRSSNTAGYFNLLPANSETAIHIGSISGDKFSGRLPRTGDYRIRVYLMRSAARRNEVSNYSLSVRIGGGGNAAPPSGNPDYADGVSGGPDYWRVARLTPGDTLNVRAAPGAGSRKIGELANGERVRNLGCHMVGASKWCRIEVGTDMRFIGWVNGRYLVEG